MHISSWYKMLKEKMEADGEDFEKRICTLDEQALHVTFNAGYGLPEGEPFTAWGEKWVYFPIEYDGSESVGHAPRHPCEISLEHQG